MEYDPNGYMSGWGPIGREKKSEQPSLGRQLFELLGTTGWHLNPELNISK